MYREGRLKEELNQEVNPLAYNGGGGGWVVAHTPKVFLIFSLDDKLSAPEVFYNCSFMITRVHFETSLVMVTYYGSEI